MIGWNKYIKPMLANDDLKNALKVYSALIEKNENFTLLDVVTYLDLHEKIKQSMISNIYQNKK